jgi:hypothetical protein
VYFLKQIFEEGRGDCLRNSLTSEIQNNAESVQIRKCIF